MSRQGQGPRSLEPITGGARSNTVDIVKGIAIILVVLGHTVQGMMHRGWWVSPRAFFAESFIYSFHMPAFFFIAGLFVLGSIRKRGARSFTIEKLKTVLWPYLVVSLLEIASVPLVNHFRSVSVPVQWKAVLVDLVDGEWNWFLFTLFFCLMLALLTKKLPSWLRFLLAVALAFTPPYGPPLTNQVLHEFCFLAAGMWVGHSISTVEKIPAAATALGLVALAAIQTIAVSFRVYPWAGIALGLTGTACLFLLARLLDRHQIGNGLAWVGRASLAVFLLSNFPQGAMREVLYRVFHTQSVWLHLLLTTIFATLLPAIVWYQQDRWSVGWLFRWPSKSP